MTLNAPIQMASKRKKDAFILRMAPKVKLPTLTTQRFKLGCVRRKYSKDFYATVIALRFGSLTRTDNIMRSIP